MIIKFSETTKTTSEGEIWDYPIGKEIGLSYQKLNTRGPKSGNYLNKVCQEIYFIIKGTAVFYIDNNKYEVKEKDVIIVEPNMPFHIETSGLEYIIITRPDWYEEQYEEIK
jgi:mannose-6-phosphate isomerase-like protein (cupin superfamily)